MNAWKRQCQYNKKTCMQYLLQLNSWNNVMRIRMAHYRSRHMAWLWSWALHYAHICIAMIELMYRGVSSQHLIGIACIQRQQRCSYALDDWSTYLRSCNDIHTWNDKLHGSGFRRSRIRLLRIWDTIHAKLYWGANRAQPGSSLIVKRYALQGDKEAHSKQ